MTYEEILARFKDVKRRGDTAKAKCPCHADEKASLSITKENNKILLHCHAGCETAAIVEVVGLSMQDLYASPLAAESKEAWIRHVEKVTKRILEARYDYYDSNGVYSYSKLRFSEKYIRYGTFDKVNQKMYLKAQNKKADTLFLGRLSIKDLKKAIADNQTIYITEGEKDTLSCQKNGLVAVTYGGASDWRKEKAIFFTDAIVVILRDNDTAGKEVALKIYRDLKNVTQKISIKNPMPTKDKADITDFFAEGGTVAKLRNMAAESVEIEEATYNNIEEVKAMLLAKEEYSADGTLRGRKIRNYIKNYEIILEHDERLKGKFKLDLFTYQKYIVGAVPWCQQDDLFRQWKNLDDSNLLSIMQVDYGLSDRQNLSDAIQNVTNRHTFNQVVELLDPLEHEEEGYIKKLLPTYLGCEDTPYTYEVMKLFMLGAISRVYDSGCKFDYCPIITGDQGLGKSTFVRKLCLDDSYYCDSLDTLDGDECKQKLLAHWILEFAELKSFTRTKGGSISIKGFLSSQYDTFRMPYARRAETFPRHCVFMGTTNEQECLQDDTGNRRFLMLKAGVNEPEKSVFSSDLDEDVRKAWGEALHLYKNQNIPLVLPEELQAEATEKQKSAMQDDGMTGVIEAYIDEHHLTSICAVQIWKEVLGHFDVPTKADSARINKAIARLEGWEKEEKPKRHGNFGIQRGFRRKLTPIKAVRQKQISLENLEPAENTPFDKVSP